jgi:hypothetical protein
MNYFTRATSLSILIPLYNEEEYSDSSALGSGSPLRRASTRASMRHA